MKIEFSTYRTERLVRSAYDYDRSNRGITVDVKRQLYNNTISRYVNPKKGPRFIVIFGGNKVHTLAP